MADLSLSTVKLAASWPQSISDRWAELHAASQTRIKVAVFAVVTLVAYHYSLVSLLQTIGFDTPLAYVGLVPMFAAALAYLHRHPAVNEPAVHDRQLDYILGLPLLGAALGMVLLLPGRMGAMYWVERVDLLSLPVFVAAATILLFGTRVAWRQKVAIGYLLLAWPWPYTTVLLGTLGGFTSVTLAGLKAVLNVIPVAKAVPGLDNSGLFQVVHNGHAFPVSVVTACSGIDGMVGFLLVGIGFILLASGPAWRKVLWLATGLVLLWVTNLARLLLIFWMGQLGGEHLAIDILHPVAGLVIFCVGIALMTALAKPLGLQFVHRTATFADAQAVARSGRRSANPQFFAALGILAAASMVFGVSNSALTAYDPVATAAGEPKLGSFLAQPATPSGWRSTYLTEYSINKPLFGQSSRWFRYIFTPSGTPSDLHSSLPVTADVINAKGLGGFNQYGVAACYSFHGYHLADVAKVDLGDGISGQALSYSGTGGQDWSIVYWIWPVATSTGTRYERVILYVQNTERAQVSTSGSQHQISGLKGALSPGNAVQHRLLDNRAFLVAFAREVIQGQTKQKDSSAVIAALDPGGARRAEVAAASANASTGATAIGVTAAGGPGAAQSGSTATATGSIPAQHRIVLTGKYLQQWKDWVAQATHASHQAAGAAPSAPSK